MKKPRCKICDKKLVNGFCSECGLQERYAAASTKEQEIMWQKEKSKASKILWAGACILLILMPVVLNIPPFEFLVSGVQRQQVMTAIPQSIYENASRELSANGASMEVTLEEGNYIVGIDIPEGLYQVSVVSRIASIDLEDTTNQIDFFAWLHKESNSNSSYLQNVRLYQGAILCIETGKILFASSNAQISLLQTLPQNEDVENYYVEDGAVAGADFPEGTYDITVCGGGRGLVKVSFPTRNEDSLGFLDVMGNGEGELTCFRNVEFPKGTMLEISDVDIALVPSVRNSLMR